MSSQHVFVRMSILTFLGARGSKSDNPIRCLCAKTPSRDRGLATSDYGELREL